MMKKLLQTLLYVLITGSTFGSDLKEKVILQALQDFEYLDQKNTLNDIEGKSILNQYVIDLNPNWIEEKPEIKFLNNNYEALSQQMIRFNTGRKDQLRFYVIIVNDYQAELNETIEIESLPAKIENLEDLVKFPQKNDGYIRFRNELSEIPASIAAKLAEKGYNERIIYFYSRARLYKLDGKEKIYYHDNLTLLGENIQKNDAQIRSSAKANISQKDLLANKIEKLVGNIINAVEVVIDNGNGIAIRCEDTYANLVEKTATSRTSEKIEQAASSFVNILDKADPSKFLILEGLNELRDDHNYFSVVLPDKLKLLANSKNNSPFKIYIVGKKVDFVLPNSELDDFAKAVALKSTKNDGKSIFIVLPYFQLSGTNYTSPQGWYGQPVAEGTGLYSPGIYSPDEALAKKMATALRGPGSFATSFDQAFKCIPKKHVEYRYIISYDFNLVALETKVNGNVSGYENIYDLNISVDQRLKKYIELQLKRKDWTGGLSVGGLQDITNINNQLTALAEQTPSFYRLEHGLIESWLSETVDSKRNYYSKVAEQYVYWFANKKLKSTKLWQESTSYDFSGISYDSPPPHYFVLGHNPEVLEEQFDMLDKAGMGFALFNLDWTTDAAGFLLACRYKSTTNKYIYGAALATPVVCAVILRRGANVFKNANNAFEVVEGTAGEFAGIYGKLKNELQWSDELIAQFEKDFAGNVDIVKKFETGELLVDSWKGLLNRPEWVRTNTDLLERITAKGDDYIAKVDELYSPTVMKLPPNLKPPNNPPGSFNGIDYDKFGFPKFESYVSDKSHVVKIAMDGSNDDYIRAYEKLKDIVGEGNIQFTNSYGSSFKIKKNGQWSEPYTWHHHQDGESMMPVLQTIHQSVQNYHSGGRSIVNKGLKDLFDSPQF